MSREAMKLALEALEILTDGYDGTEVGVEIEAITALRQALETEQEPVECMCGICKLGKREWVGLTLREIEKCIYDANDDRIVACRNVEAKLKEKNT